MLNAAGLLEDTGAWAYLVIFVVIALEGVPFVGPFIPAQLFLLGAGFVASLGHIGAVRVWALALTTLVLADFASFGLGHRYGESVLRRLPAGVRRRADGVRARLETHLRKSLILAQFLGPARALIPPLAGSTRVRWREFVLWNGLGCLLWVTFCISAGWVFGESYARLAALLGKGAVVVVLLALVLYLAASRFRAARAEESGFR